MPALIVSFAAQYSMPDSDDKHASATSMPSIIVEGLDDDEREPTVPIPDLGPVVDLREIPPSFRPGQTLEHGFELTRMLGMGGMGGVVLARDCRLDREVAIKFIRPSWMPSSLARQRFLDEARAMARVRHENVVTIYAAGEVDNSPYFVMEYVPGTTLAHLCHERGSLPFDIDEALRILRYVALAVDSIHQAGTFHLDLKPSNVLIGSKFRIAVTDFGLARVAPEGGQHAEHEIDENQEVYGSPAYLSPEMIYGQPGVAASDIYSLSVLAYRLFTGRIPFAGATPQDTLHAHVEQFPKHPSDVCPNLPRALGDAIIVGLAKEPGNRPKSALELYRDMARGARSVAPRHGDEELRIVIADDDDDMRRLVKEIVQAVFPTADVEAVGDGRQALECLMRKPASLAIIDLRMPELDGFQVTRAIRSTESINRTPIIVMTAQGGAPEWRVLFSLGANSFIAKPFTPSDMVVAIRRFLGHSAEL